jgi:hypothetical protein
MDIERLHNPFRAEMAQEDVRRFAHLHPQPMRKERESAPEERAEMPERE